MTFEWTGPEEAPVFDQAFANSLVGQRILIGITYVDAQGVVLEQVQMHGIIESASTQGLTVVLAGLRAGESVVMPPALDHIAPAAPGVYRLRTTGETVENPDLLATWSVTRRHQP